MYFYVFENVSVVLTVYYNQHQHHRHLSSHSSLISILVTVLTTEAEASSNRYCKVSQYVVDDLKPTFLNNLYVNVTVQWKN